MNLDQAVASKTNFFLEIATTYGGKCFIADSRNGKLIEGYFDSYQEALDRLTEARSKV